jgi:hypothetical protein
VPPLPWCDWEALKLAVLLRQPSKALEAANRLSTKAPPARWRYRETTPAKVAEVIGRMAAEAPDRAPWLRILDLLVEQATAPDLDVVHGVRRAVSNGEDLPPTRPIRPTVLAPEPEAARLWQAAKLAYERGALRDDDLLLDPALLPLWQYDLGELLRIRRDF